MRIEVSVEISSCVCDTGTVEEAATLVRVDPQSNLLRTLCPYMECKIDLA